MATIILNHRVKDYNSWKALYDADHARRDSAGMTELAIGQKAGDPGNVFIIWKAEDATIMEKMMANPELKKVMQEGGVISAPEITVIH